MELVVASTNPGKVAEIRALLAGASDERGRVITVLGLDDVPGAPFPEPAETGATFEENARIKAEAYAAATGRLVLADDSGLEIDALGGRPGVISSHYSTDGRETGATRAQRDAANIERVLQELDGVPPRARTARFRCVMVLASATLPSAGHSGPAPRGAKPRVLFVTSGTFEGRMGVPPDVPRGGGGFGYDPVFLVGPEYTRTSAELTAEEKNARSHRGAALRAMAALLRGQAGGL
ncbi:MAG: non-canonical purine NTP pyrophosphatase [Planctomycetota bacterium]|nr:non-canonical purine NTP pyrophosphatase [Planctomycetota bacterium]